MAHLRTEPSVADWMTGGGWTVEDAGPQRVGRPDFGTADLSAVRSAVLERLGVSREELLQACSSAGVRRVTDAGVRLPGSVLTALGVRPGDSVQFCFTETGAVELRRAEPVDVPAVRARLRSVAGVSPRLLARLFALPYPSVRRVLKGDSDAQD